MEIMSRWANPTDTLFSDSMRGVTCTFEHEYICGYDSNSLGLVSEQWTQKQGSDFALYPGINMCK